MNLAITVVAFLVALSVLIVIHEYGHYLIARLCGVRVLRFSMGFGRPLWSVRHGPDQTEWVVAALPLGGYVKMLDEHEGPVAARETHRAFNRQSVWRRIAIVVAGPVANFAFAVVIYWALFVHGVQEAKPVVAAPVAGSVAAASGLRRGETILKINDEPVISWQDVRWRMLRLAVEKQAVRLEVIDARQHIAERTLDLTGFDLERLDGDPMARLGLVLDRPEVAPVVGTILAGSVADAGGLRPGDRITAVDGRPIRVWDELVAAVQAHAGVTIRLSVSRGAIRIEIPLQPKLERYNGKAIGRIGAGPQVDPQMMKDLMTTISYGPVSALGRAAQRTWETSAFSLKMLGKMVTGEVSWRNLSGPVTIADYAGQSAQLGVSAYLEFLALISISLGVLNLLPIPLLDGGHLLYYVVEIFKGSPVSERTMELGQRLGLTVLLFLMAFAFYNDLNRLFTG
jgi:regulator of sigma E protease